MLEQSAGDTLDIDGTVDPSDIRQYTIEMDQSHHLRNVVRDQGCAGGMYNWDPFHHHALGEGTPFR